MRHGNSMNCYLLLLILPFAISLPSDAGAGPRGSGNARPPVVTVMVVTEQEVNHPAEYVGRVEAIQAVDLRARVEGYLEKVKFKEGADVSAGKLLYLIEQAPYMEMVNQTRAKVAEATASLKNARQYLQRLKAARSGAVSATDLETAANAELQAMALLQGSKANLEQAKINLGYTMIKAPINGRIGRTTFTKGNLVDPGSGALARIVQTHPIRVVYSMSENNLTGARQARKTGNQETQDCRLVPRIRLQNGEMYPTAGRLDFVDNQVDPGTGTIAIRAVFDNPDDLLLPGQYVTVLVSCKEGKRLPTVPQSAVQEDREGRYVFVVDAENRVQQRRIATGVVIGTNWSVQSGLRVGETVIIQGVQKVIPGQTVETITEVKQNME